MVRAGDFIQNSLANEMGIYTTPYEHFGKLTYEMWRACRLVVDTGMHVFGWSRQRAVDFMAENTALSIHEINTEIDRCHFLARSSARL